jgi:hypothetical protein
MSQESKIEKKIAVLYFLIALAAITLGFNFRQSAVLFNTAIWLTLPCSIGYAFFMWSYIHGADINLFVGYLILCAAINTGIIYWLTRFIRTKVMARRRDAA